ncbi:MAG TPA: nuclear transport factor 2 family protein [Candidatus Limnocylindrales bacterium]|nr:nuclear transport factor 2 family protein [Candidatus Limnocylindrales bacterium]
MATLTHGDAQDLVTAFKEAWEKRAPDLIVELFDDGADYRVDPFSEPLSGINAIRDLWNNIAAAQTHVEFDAERVWLSGQTVLASWHAAYTRRATAERVRVRGFMTMELGEGTPLRVMRFRQWPQERVVGMDSTFAAEEG